jgi:hypothetical protein
LLSGVDCDSADFVSAGGVLAAADEVVAGDGVAAVGAAGLISADVVSGADLSGEVAAVLSVSLLSGLPLAKLLACAAKSAGDGGGTLAGSGTGTAASIANSAAEVLEDGVCAETAVVPRPTKAATTAASTRS